MIRTQSKRPRHRNKKHSFDFFEIVFQLKPGKHAIFHRERDLDNKMQESAKDNSKSQALKAEHRVQKNNSGYYAEVV